MTDLTLAYTAPGVYVRISDLPVVITQPGDYITRSGKRVTIREIRNNADPSYTSFAAKGSVWRIFRGQLRPRGLSIWHVSGRYSVFLEHGLDIVGKWPEGKA